MRYSDRASQQLLNCEVGPLLMCLAKAMKSYEICNWVNTSTYVYINTKMLTFTRLHVHTYDKNSLPFQH